MLELMLELMMLELKKQELMKREVMKQEPMQLELMKLLLMLHRMLHLMLQLMLHPLEMLLLKEFLTVQQEEEQITTTAEEGEGMEEGEEGNPDHEEKGALSKSMKSRAVYRQNKTVGNNWRSKVMTNTFTISLQYTAPCNRKNHSITF